MQSLALEIPPLEQTQPTTVKDKQSFMPYAITLVSFIWYIMSAYEQYK